MAQAKSQREISKEFRQRRAAQAQDQINIWLPHDLKARVDEAVKAKGFKSRSELITQLLEGNLESDMG